MAGGDAELGPAHEMPAFNSEEPRSVLTWAWGRFAPSIAATSSFQTQSVPLLHMISIAAPRIPILFLDTGFHFPETLAFRDRLVEQLRLNLQVLEPKMGHDGFLREHGELYRRDPDLCCHINKVEPLRRARAGLRAWISGIRRDQTPDRSNTPVVARQADGVVKVCPLAAWTQETVNRYMEEFGLPRHPLEDEGYLSIGCAPCTRRVRPGEDPRAGRWAESDKTECGLHLDDLGGSKGKRDGGQNAL